MERLLRRPRDDSETDKELPRSGLMGEQLK